MPVASVLMPLPAPLTPNLALPAPSIQAPPTDAVARPPDGGQSGIRLRKTISRLQPATKIMRSDVFEMLVGLRLTIARRAADMLVLHFGDIRPHASGEGTVGAYALHIQCPWRLDGPIVTLTGRDDLWEYAGPGERPSGWTYEDGLSLQDKRLGEFMGSRDERTRSWVNQGVRHFVLSAQQTNLGDVTLELTGGGAIRLFPARSKGEAWRLFAPGSARHVIFPEAS